MALHESKVIIVGAGTAGLIAAKHIAMAGLPVSVYEQKKGISEHINASGILSIEGIDSLGMDYRKAITNTFYGARLHAGGTTLEILSSKPKAYNIERHALAEICYDEASKAGAEILFGRKVEKSEALALSSKGSIIIGADGAVSSISSAFGFGGIKRYVLTYKANYRVKGIDTKMVDIFFDNNVTPGLFGWLAPINEEVLEAGIGIDSRKGNSKRAYDNFMKKKEIKKALAGARFLHGGASIIPMSTRPHFVDESRNVLLVGDAAGQTKASTGGGIIFSGNAAILAAEAVQRHMKEGKQLSDYERAWLKKYSKEVRAHNMIHSIYSSMGNGMLEATFKFLKVIGIEDLLAKHGNMDEPTKIIKSIFKGK